MLDELKKSLCASGNALYDDYSIQHTWKNISAIDRNQGMFVITNSNVFMNRLIPEKIAIADMMGLMVEGSGDASYDVRTHMELYWDNPDIGAIVQTESVYVMAWAQAGLEIPCFGRCHAEYFYKAIPCIRELTEQESSGDFEGNLSRLVTEEIRKKKEENSLNAVICEGHGAFTWGTDSDEAVLRAIKLEEVAKTAYLSVMLNPEIKPLRDYIEKNKYILYK